MCTFSSLESRPARFILLSLLFAPCVTRALSLGSTLDSLRSEPKRSQVFREMYQRAEGYPNQAKVSVDLPIYITVGIMDRQTKVRLSSTSGFSITCGGVTLQAPSKEKWSVVLIKGKPAKVESLPVLAKIPIQQASLAETSMRKWKEKGCHPRLIPMGVLLREKGTGRILNDNRCVFLALEPEETWTAAWNKCIELSQYGANPTVFEQLVEPQSGIVAVVNPKGKVVARGRGARIRSTGAIAVHEVEHDRDLPQHGFETRKYGSPVDVRIDALGRLAVTTPVEFEEYLKGVVPSEIYASDPMETIRAQTVAARSETMAGLGLSGSGDPFDICSDQHCQAYKGEGGRSSNTDQGVEDTQGQVLMYGDSILNAVYSDTCGGHTENLEMVWSLPANPAMKGRSDAPEGNAPLDLSTDEGVGSFLAEPVEAYCAKDKGGSSQHFRWKVVKSQSELTESINRRYKVGKVRALKPLERGVSGRIRRLLVTGSLGEAVIFKELAIRQALGGLRSAMFTVETEMDKKGRPKFVFQGGGWGHGVGLCQSGARARALAGQDYRTILDHYYHGARLANLH